MKVNGKVCALPADAVAGAKNRYLLRFPAGESGLSPLIDLLVAPFRGGFRGAFRRSRALAEIPA
jgi:hypothetical protein